MSSPSLRICVVGAGAAGLCAARRAVEQLPGAEVSILEQSDQLGGTWVYTEQQQQQGGQPTHSSMYAELRTNIPKEIMNFCDFPIESVDFSDHQNSDDSFPRHEVILSYLKRFAEPIKHLIKFNLRVLSIVPFEGDKISHLKIPCQANDNFGTKWRIAQMSVRKCPSANVRPQMSVRKCLDAEIVGANGEKPLPIPKIPLPNNVIGFNRITFTYFDHNVITFLGHFHRFFASSTTSLTIATDDVRISEFFVSTIWPMFSDSIRDMSLTISGFRLLRQLAPSILNDCPSLRFVTFVGKILPEFPPDDSANATDGQAVAKWLFTPRPKDEMNVLKCRVAVEQWSSRMEQIKAAFSAASSRVCFSILFEFSPSSSIDSVVPFKLTNELTGEKLTGSKCFKNGVLLIRCSSVVKTPNMERTFIRRMNEVIIKIGDGGVDDGLLDNSPGPNGQHQNEY